MESCNCESQEFRAYLENELIYLGTFGLSDPLRDGVKDAIRAIKEKPPLKGKKKPQAPGGKEGQQVGKEPEPGEGAGPGDRREREGIRVRIVTGDHIETAKFVAVQAGVVDSEEELVRPGAAMTGEQFRKAVGTYYRNWDEAKGTHRIDFADEGTRFEKVRLNLKIIARATSEDRYILVAGI